MALQFLNCDVGELTITKHAREIAEEVPKTADCSLPPFR
jgi:hypothetical protein